MKILVVGDWHSDLHEEEVCRSLKRLGHEVHGFKWFQYFSYDTAHSHSPDALMKRAQNRYLAGPLMRRINRDFQQQALACKPDLIFIYRGTHILPDTLKALKAALPACRLVGYNNDDPFSPTQPAYYWRHFMAGIRQYDLMLAYRHANIKDFERAGAKRVDLMRSWYVPDRSHPVELNSEETKSYGADVVFIGHFEADQRLDHFEAIARQGFSLRLFGPAETWVKPIAQSNVLRHLAPVQKVWGESYNKALCGAKIALCFFSKLNRDTYTRRCFEIPATRTLMLAEYSEDLASLYTEGIEADYFRDRDEMMDKIRFYMTHPEIREKVAEAGFQKVQSAGHDIDSRMRCLLQLLEVENFQSKIYP